jgi:ABC-type multidrug transport system fused ATPase/permease subunit
VRADYESDAPPAAIERSATSGTLQERTERILTRALERLCANKTVLLIAHRLSTIEQADRIVVMDKGTVAEMGTREELLAEKGFYARMIRTKQEVEAEAHAITAPAV